MQDIYFIYFCWPDIGNSEFTCRHKRSWLFSPTINRETGNLWPVVKQVSGRKALVRRLWQQADTNHFWSNLPTVWKGLFSIQNTDVLTKVPNGKMWNKEAGKQTQSPFSACSFSHAYVFVVISFVFAVLQREYIPPQWQLMEIVHLAQLGRLLALELMITV